MPLTLYAEPAGAGFTLTALTGRCAVLRERAGNNEIRFSHFFQSAPFGIATLDRAGRIASANTAFMRMMLDGTAPAQALAADVLGRNADPDSAPSSPKALPQFSRAAATSRRSISRLAIKPPIAGATRNSFRRVYMSPLADAAAEEAGALYLIDTTEQKALEARIVQSQKMEAVGKLAGGIAHDFNNVLTAIIGNSDLLLKRNRPVDPAYKDLMNIRSAALRAAGLVANLLGFSRKQTQQVSLLNLGEVMTDLTPILKTVVGEKIELKIRSERDLWYVKADKTQIDNVIINLSVNARDAMPNGGTLTIRTRNVPEREAQKMARAGFTPGEYVLIEVADTGTGMSAGSHGQDLRAVLHDQGRRQGHRPRPRLGLRHRQAVGRFRFARERSRQGHDIQGLSAALHAGRRRRDRSGIACGEASFAHRRQGAST